MLFCPGHVPFSERNDGSASWTTRCRGHLVFGPPHTERTRDEQEQSELVGARDSAPETFGLNDIYPNTPGNYGIT